MHARGSARLRGPPEAARVRLGREGRLELLDETALRQCADDLVGDLAVLEEEQHRNREHVVLGRRPRVVGDVVDRSGQDGSFEVSVPACYTKYSDSGSVSAPTRRRRWRLSPVWVVA